MKRGKRSAGRAAARARKSAWSGVKRLLGKLSIWILTAVLVVLALLAIVYRDKLNFDAAKRFVAYGSIAKNEEGLTDEFVFSGDNHNSFATLDGGLLLCSNSTLQLYSSSGRQELDLGVTMEHPVLDTSGEWAVIYDAGGSDLYVYRGSEEIFAYKTPKDYDLISAHINENGYFSVVEQTPGYKATVTVYDSRASRRMSWNESTSFLMDAAVSPDNRTMAVVKVAQEKADFRSELVFYRVKDAGITASTPIGDDVVLNMVWKGNKLWVQGESGVYILSAEGELLGKWKDGLRNLERYDLGGDGFAVVLRSKYRSAGTGELLLVNQNGDEVVSRTISDEVLSISAAGDYIAVLTPGQLTVYRGQLEEYAALPGATARKAIMRSDGSVMVIEGESAKLFSP